MILYLVSAFLCYGMGVSNAVEAHINIAKGKKTSQSSTLYGAGSERAVDGNTNRSWHGGSVTHTQCTNDKPWWEVDLEALYLIDEIKVFNRGDCCSSRLNNFYVMIYNTNDGKDTCRLFKRTSF